MDDVWPKSNTELEILLLLLVQVGVRYLTNNNYLIWRFTYTRFCSFGLRGIANYELRLTCCAKTKFYTSVYTTSYLQTNIEFHLRWLTNFLSNTYIFINIIRKLSYRIFYVKKKRKEGKEIPNIVDYCFTKRVTVNSITDELLDLHILRQSTSPYASSIVLVSKKNSEERLIMSRFTFTLCIFYVLRFAVYVLSCAFEFYVVFYVDGRNKREISFLKTLLRTCIFDSRGTEAEVVVAIIMEVRSVLLLGSSRFMIFRFAFKFFVLVFYVVRSTFCVFRFMFCVLRFLVLRFEFWVFPFWVLRFGLCVLRVRFSSYILLFWALRSTFCVFSFSRFTF